MENLTAETFKEKVFDYTTGTEFSFKGSKPAVIDFYADWCGPCKMLSPILEALSTEYPNVDFYKINTEDEVELAATFGIRSIPTLLFLPVNGEPRMSVGAMPKEGFVKAFNELFGI